MNHVNRDFGITIVEGSKLNNHNAEVIDELNRRIEEALDEDDTEKVDTIKSFYDWYIEKYII